VSRWRFVVRNRVDRVVLIASSIAGLACVVGALIDPRRAANAYLVAYASVLGTVLALLLLVMVIDVSAGAWFAPLRPHAEAVIGTLPALGLLFLPIVLGSRLMYSWTAPGALPNALRVAVESKESYLNAWFALARAAVYWAVWIAIGERVRALSRRRDLTLEPDVARRLRTVNAVGLVLMGLTITFAAFDLLMSLQPDWSSSIYGVYFFAGGSVGALALCAVLAAHGVRAGSATGMTKHTLHTAAKLLLTMLLFWVYVAYSQYLVVWIADLPLEVGWYTVRTSGGWRVVAGVLLVGHLVVPFLALLVYRLKRNPWAMTAIGAWLLMMHALDTYWLVMPSWFNAPSFHWLDLACLAFVVSVVAATARWRSAPSVADSRPSMPGATVSPA